MTDKTPIQFSDDDRQLLRQMAALMQDMNVRLSTLEEKVSTLDEKVEARLYDTRPMWEQLFARLEKVESRLDRLEARVLAVEVGLREFKAEMKVSLKDIDRDINTMQLGFARRYADVGERLDKLEQESAHKH